MKQSEKGFMGILLLTLVVVLVVVVAANYKLFKDNQAEELRQQQLQEQEPPKEIDIMAVPEVERPEDYTEITLSVFGDLVPHDGINDQSRKADGKYDYTRVFAGAIPFASATDYSILSLETTFPMTEEYSGSTMFKSPDALAKSIKTSGFDLVNTAGNHCMDGLKGGLIRTIDVLEQNGLDHVGT